MSINRQIMAFIPYFGDLWLLQLLYSAFSYTISGLSHLVNSIGCGDDRILNIRDGPFVSVPLFHELRGRKQEDRPNVCEDYGLRGSLHYRLQVRRRNRHRIIKQGSHTTNDGILGAFWFVNQVCSSLVESFLWLSAVWAFPELKLPVIGFAPTTGSYFISHSRFVHF